VLSDTYFSPTTTVTSPHPEARRSSAAVGRESGSCGGEHDGRAGEEADEEMTKHGQVGLAAMRAGVDRKTARKYVEAASCVGAGRAA